MLRLAAQEADKAWRAMIEEVKPGMPAWKLDAMFSYYASKLNLEHGTASRGHNFIARGRARLRPVRDAPGLYPPGW